MRAQGGWTSKPRGCCCTSRHWIPWCVPTRCPSSSDSEEGDRLDDPHGYKVGKEDKAQRHAVFAAWLVDIFGADLLLSGKGIIDVAAGKGLLSHELSILCHGLACALVDPALQQGQETNDGGASGM